MVLYLGDRFVVLHDAFNHSERGHVCHVKNNALQGKKLEPSELSEIFDAKAQYLQKLKFKTIIEELDIPLLTLLKDDVTGELFLKKPVDWRGRNIVHLYVSTSKSAVDRYMRTTMSLLELLTLPNEDVGYVTLETSRGVVIACRRVKVSELSSEFLPSETAMFDKTSFALCEVQSII